MALSDKILFITLFSNGVLTLFCLLTLARGKKTLGLNFFPFVSSLPFLKGLLVYLILLLISFAITLPTHSPFSPGQQLGKGYLIGGFFALLALLLNYQAYSLISPSLLSPQASQNTQEQRPFSVGGIGIGVSALALLGITLVYLLFRNDSYYALIGFAFSSCLASFLSPAIPPGNPQEHSGELRKILLRSFINSSPLAFYLLFAVGLPATLLIANFHYEALGKEKPIGEELWKLFPLVVATFSLASGWIGQGIRKGGLLFLPLSLRDPLTLVISFSLFIYGIWPMTRTLFGYPPLFQPLLIGTLSGLFLLGLATEETRRTLKGSTSFQIPLTTISIFLLLLILLACMKLLGGYGVGLGAIALLGVLITIGGLTPLPFHPNENLRHNQLTPITSLSLVPLLVPALILAVFFRLFLEEMALRDIRLHLSALSVHFGLLVGALLPLCLWDLSSFPKETANSPPTFLLMVRKVMIGAMTVATPFLAWLFWGEGATAGVLAGLFFAQCLGVFREYSSPQSNSSLNFSTITLGMALVAYQFAPLMLRMEPFLTRTLRVKIALALFTLGIGALVWQNLKARHSPPEVE